MLKFFLFLVYFFIMLPVFAQEDKVIARVNGEDITLANLKATAQQAMAGKYNDNVLNPENPLYKRILDILLQRRIMVQEAQKVALDKRYDIEKQIETVREMVLADAYITEQVSKNITDDVLKKQYDEVLKSVEGEYEVHASHILVPTQEKAYEVIAKVKEGENFSELAKSFSQDPGAQNGGDLGYFGKGQMVPTFEQAAFLLDKGEYTLDPVQSKFGWHVILSHDKRPVAVPSFEEAKNNIRQQLSQTMVQNLIRSHSENATVEISDENGILKSWKP